MPRTDYDINDAVFDEVRHVYTWKGQRVPGVTTLLTESGYRRPITPQAGQQSERCSHRVAPEVMARALQRGSDVHEYADYRDKGVMRDDLVTPTTVNYIAADEELRRRFDFEPICGEVAFIDPIDWFGGKFDVVGWWGGKRTLVDRKTGGVHPSVWIQLVAYKRLWEFWNPESPIDQMAVFHLQGNAVPRLLLHPCPAFAEQTWQAIVQRQRWLRRFGGW